MSSACLRVGGVLHEGYRLSALDKYSKRNTRNCPEKLLNRQLHNNYISTPLSSWNLSKTISNQNINVHKHKFKVAYTSQQCRFTLAPHFLPIHTFSCQPYVRLENPTFQF